MPILAEYDTNVIANMSGNTIEEYCEMAEILSDTDVAIFHQNRGKNTLHVIFTPIFSFYNILFILY